jgi:predicted ribosomally synthesized peptide with nif11-like leader
MPLPELERLFDAATRDFDLRQELQRVGSDQELAELADGRGYRVTVADVIAMRRSLSDDQLQQVAGGFSSNHPAGANFVFGDGSVRSIRTILPYIEQDNLYKG